LNALATLCSLLLDRPCGWRRTAVAERAPTLLPLPSPCLPVPDAAGWRHPQWGRDCVGPEPRRCRRAGASVCVRHELSTVRLAVRLKASLLRRWPRALRCRSCATASPSQGSAGSTAPARRGGTAARLLLPHAACSASAPTAGCWCGCGASWAAPLSTGALLLAGGSEARAAVLVEPQ
jgi:hypothetical protein